MVGRFRWLLTTDVLSAVILAVAVWFPETRAQCNGILQLTAWPYITSPLSFPRQPPYPAESSCYWLIRTASSGQIVRLDLTNLNLEWEPSCSLDRLEIFDGDSFDSLQLARLCGSLSNGTYYSTGRDLFLSFTSDATVQFSGFSFTYSAVPSSPATTTYSPPWLTNNNACGYRSVAGLTARPDVIQAFESPNYPSPYPGSANCNWLLRSYSPGTVVKIVIEDITLENSTYCIYDRLTIFDGDSRYSPSLAILCGRQLYPQTFYSSGSSAFVSFTSDGFIEDRGFRITFQAVAPVTSTPRPWWIRTSTPDDGGSTSICVSEQNEALTAEIWTFKYIQSHNFSRSYPNNARCAWSLQAAAGYVIHVQVIRMDLETANNCAFDNVTLYDASWEFRSAVIATLCDASSASEYYSTGNSMYITFKSDNSITATGFRLRYQAVPAYTVTTDLSTSSVCNNGYSGGSYLTAVTWTEKYIQSPNYPGLYPNDVRCAWTVQTDAGYVIYVRVLSMDLECSFDAVTLYDASWESSSAQLARLCSASATSDYYSTGSSMYITFKSDGSIAKTGFRLMYKAMLASEVTKPPFSYSSYQTTVRPYTVMGIVIGVIVFLGLLALVALLIVKRRQAAVKRSQRALNGGSYGPPPYTTPASHFVLGGTVQQGPSGYVAGVGGGYIAFDNLGYVQGPPPAYADLRGVTGMACASGPVTNPQGRDQAHVDAEGAGNGSDVAVAPAGNGDSPANELTVEPAPPPYESLGLPQAAVPCASPPFWPSAVAVTALQPETPLQPSASAPVEPSSPTSQVT